jgi:endonuclease/exonuclease/phosphatase family metal-dependent hydrolase
MRLPLGLFGNAILSRRPVHRWEWVDLSVPGKEPRNAVIVDVELAGAHWTVVNSHFGLSLAERHAQVTRLERVFDRLHSPRLIFLGDLNAWQPARDVLRRLRRRFGEHPAVRSFPAHRPTLALDRVYVRPKTAIQTLNVHDSRMSRIASDHLPVWASVTARP